MSLYLSSTFIIFKDSKQLFKFMILVDLLILKNLTTYIDGNTTDIAVPLHLNSTLEFLSTHDSEPQ